MKEIKQLTRSELQVMLVLWNLPKQHGYTGDILAQYADPKPAYTTLATFLKILTQKGFVKYRKIGNKLFYTPLVSQTEYAECFLAPTKEKFFGGSFYEMMRFFLRRENLSLGEVNDLIQLIHETQGK